ncbi:SAM-dependent methyltransferase [Nonomuraea antimicrobica]|uniref:SAM-dependent methyltransferase n=1 Tax=Nonomuraea antimicrobica TaxID=561173 RepID=A0ABP7C9G0_9ACTN
MTEQERAPAGIDPTVPSVARMYDYLLGGKDNFAADREAAARIIKISPNAKEISRDNRAFLGRAVRAVAELGIRQFLDIGTGLPTQENVHQVAQRANPSSRVVYVDNDPIVLVHARALLATTPGTIVVNGDMRDPKAILGHPKITQHLDLSSPLAVLLVSVLHFIPDDDEAFGIARDIRQALPSGSHLILSHVTAGGLNGEDVGKGRAIYRGTTSGGLAPRSREQIASFFEGLELLEPGLVAPAVWRADGPGQLAISGPGGAGFLGAVGRVP